MALDIDEARRQTPGCAGRAHLNNAGSGLMTARTLDAMVTHLEREAALGGYEAQDAAAPETEAVYDAVAELLGADAGEIALLDNATRAWSAAFHALDLRPGDRVLVSRAEYHSNILTLRRAETHGVKIEAVPDDEHGQLDTAALENLLDQRTRLVAAVHIPSGNGLVNPVEQIGRITRAADVPFLLDATQSAAHLPLDVEAIGCDLLCATGRKYLRGPRGTGFLYASTRILERLTPIHPDVRSTRWTAQGLAWAPGARRFETFERPVAAHLGLGAAVRQALETPVEETSTRALALADQLRAALDTIDGITVHDRGLRKSAIVTAGHTAIPADHLATGLRARGVNLSTTWPPYPGTDSPESTVPLLRFSPHFYNTEHEIDAAAEALAALVH